MCLDTLWSAEKLTKLQKKSETEPIRAWKVVGRSGVNLTAQYQCYKKIFKTNYAVNIDSAKGTIESNKMGFYGKGFHAYANKPKWDPGMYARVIPVLLWDIVAAGKQNNRTVYVARKMMLLV